MSFPLLIGILLMTWAGAAGAFYLKKGAGALSMRTLGLALRTPSLYAGIAFYCIGMGINIFLLRFVEYTVLYPMTAITYIWSMLLASFALKEKITWEKMLAIALIVTGVFLIAQK